MYFRLRHILATGFPQKQLAVIRRLGNCLTWGRFGHLPPNNLPTCYFKSANNLLAETIDGRTQMCFKWGACVPRGQETETATNCGYQHYRHLLPFVTEARVYHAIRQNLDIGINTTHTRKFEIWFFDTQNAFYRVVFLTGPPNFQYQNEKRWTANQRFCSMKFSMYKRSS